MKPVRIDRDATNWQSVINERKHRRWLKWKVYVNRYLDSEIREAIEARRGLLEKGKNPFESQYRKKPYF